MKERRRLLSNKRADIPTIILVLGVFIVCSLTLLSFYFAGIKDSNFFEGVLLVKAVSEAADDIRFYDKLGKDSLGLTGLSQGVEKRNFKLSGKFDEQKKGYVVEGTFNEKKLLGFVEGDQLVHVKYEFPKSD